MRGAGVSFGTPVVVYDGGQGWAAARAWWMLRLWGHPGDVRVLDGGLPSWRGGLSTDTPEPAEGDFRPRPDAVVLHADGAAALARSGVLLDARRGALPGRCRTDRPGRRPHPGRDLGAHHGERGSRRLLPPGGGAAARFKALGVSDDSTVGVYCGSGVSGAHEVLALAVAGVPAALYVGSWSEWSSDPSRPVAVGPDPQ
ncbi:Sulfurtransferase OS=Streptomyces alboniger OX=132473 GN=CP975_26990 PE=4 SV=1 [Streptomyces alboniger]